MDVLNQIPFNLHRVLTKYIKEELLLAVLAFSSQHKGLHCGQDHIWSGQATQNRLIEAENAL